MRRVAADKPAERWAYGDYYLDQPHPGRGGVWYACRYDAKQRVVRRRSLRTSDFEQAKQKLVELAGLAPAASEDAPGPRDVMTIAVLDAYLKGHATSIDSEAYASRAIKLATEYLIQRRDVAAPVAYWTPSRQIEFARYLHQTYSHKASTIERTFNVIRSAFLDATKVKMRADLFGHEIEGALMSHAPPIGMKQAEVARELKLADDDEPLFVPTLDEMAHFIDTLETRHLRRWIVIALSTWARPEAVTDFDPGAQWDRRTGLVSLNPKGRAQTKKRRARILCCRTLAACLDAWRDEDTRPDPARRYTVPDPWMPLFYKGEKVGTVKQAIRRAAAAAGLPGITQKTTRTFMATMVMKLCDNVHRDTRSIWLGHVVPTGSRTTDHYEVIDADYLKKPALATDYVLQLLHDRCSNSPFAIEARLNDEEMARIGAVPAAPKEVAKSMQKKGFSA